MTLWERFRRAAPYHAYFLGSFNHAWLALVTLGIGIAVATPLSLLIGTAVYGLGVIFLPDTAAFHKKVDEKRAAEISARLEEETAVKDRVRAGLLKKLSPKAKTRWESFSALCTELRTKLNDTEGDSLMGESSLAKVADSHLLLLAMDAETRDYLATAETPAVLKERAAAIEAELAKLHSRTDLSDVEQRLVLSKEETLKNIRQQADQNKRMQLNLELAQSELARLESQISSLKAELISTPASQLSNRLGQTLIQVEASQRVLQEGGMVNAPDLNVLLGENA